MVAGSGGLKVTREYYENGAKPQHTVVPFLALWVAVTQQFNYTHAEHGNECTCSLLALLIDDWFTLLADDTELLFEDDGWATFLALGLFGRNVYTIKVCLFCFTLNLSDKSKLLFEIKGHNALKLNFDGVSGVYVTSDSKTRLKLNVYHTIRRSCINPSTTTLLRFSNNIIKNV